MIEALCRNSGNDINVSSEEKLCVELAGLCHDLGHGPLSHSWERYLKASGINWKVLKFTIIQIIIIIIIYLFNHITKVSLNIKIFFIKNL